jgi:hypothetical protein
MNAELVPQFKHDVAFSFLARDLQLATKFADALAPLTSFVYVRQQEEIAGTDGQESFRAAFRFDSRLNVILLRGGWGETPWTRVEQAAIQERCLHDGWDRLLVVNLDGGKPPRWMPATSLYLDLQSFPFEQAVGAIKRQVQQLGGDVRPPSQTDLARAKLAEADFNRQTETVFRSPEGVQLADDSVVRMVEHLRAQLQALSDSDDREWKVAGGFERGYGVVRAQQWSALFNWNRYLNDCNKGELTIRVFGAPFETPDERKQGLAFRHYGRPAAETERLYNVARHPALGVVWKRSGQLNTSEKVADETLGKMIDLMARP